ncbi:MAG: hypothetical protein ABI670_00450 [Chloroflexota bacterium]
MPEILPGQIGPGRSVPRVRSLTKVLTVPAIILAVAGLANLARANPLTQTVPGNLGNLVDVRVNQVTTADQHEPSLAVDPTNPNNVIAAAKDWRTGPKQVWNYRSTDGGKTWTDSYANLMPGELPNQSDPVVAFDATGAAYMSILGYNQNDLSVGGLFITRSNDTGATWQPPVLVAANSDDVFNDKEWLTVDRSSNKETAGNVYVTWTVFAKVSPTHENARIVVSRSTDGGQTFSERKAISPAEQTSVQGSFPVVGPNGELYVLYYSSPSGTNEEEEEGGEGGAAQAEPAGRVGALQTDAADANALYMIKSLDGGRTFEPPVRVVTVFRPPNSLAGSDFRIFILPTLAVDPVNGTLYATWNDYRAGNSDTMLVSSTDDGDTWTAPRRVNDDPAGSRADQFFPSAVVGRDSTLHLFWLDRRDDPANRSYRPYYSRSTDGGATFSKNAPLGMSLSNPDVGFQGTLLGDYIAIDVSADGSRFYAAWVDTRNGTQDIFFTTLDNPNGATSSVPVDGVAPPAPVAMPSPQPLTGFSERAFIANWERADRAVLKGKAQRPWLWGPISFAAASEPYQQGAEGTHEVQYFDKARMEINNPGLDPAAPGYVTNGLLVVELITGRVQVGDAEFEAARAPSDAPVAGDLNSPDALTYASLAGGASLNGDRRSTDRTGQAVTATLNRAGLVQDDPGKANIVKIARYESTLGHNIPDVFWTYMNATGPVYNGRFGTYSEGKVLDWESALGYPITEPYWTNVKIGGVDKSVLVQAFQRRVLTYVADNPPGWQVEMGNVGRHYFDWRYGGLYR